MTLTKFAGFARSTFGIVNLEPLDHHIGSTSPDHLALVRDELQHAGSHVIDISASVKTSFYDPDHQKRLLAIEQSKAHLDTAAALGSQSVRIHVKRCQDSKPDVSRAAETLSQIATYAASKGVVLNLENDDPESEDPFFLVKVIQKVNSPTLRALPDFGNSLPRGADFNDAALKAMFPYAYNVTHVKDVIVDSGKVYTVDVAREVAIAKHAGFRGYFSMEWEGEGDPVQGTKGLIRKTLSALS